MREYNFIFELLNENLSYISNIYPTSASFDYSALAQIKASSEMKLKNYDNFTVNDKNIRIKTNINNKLYTLATLIACGSTINKKNNTLGIKAYDRLIILVQDKLTESLLIEANTNLIKFLNEFLIEYPNTFKYDQNSFLNLADIYFPIGTSKLEVVNKLLKIMNYTNLYTTQDGIFTAKEYVLPSEREIEITYADDDTSIITPNVTQELDLFDIPNVFVRATNNVEIDPPLVAIYENNNADSFTSTIVRNRKIVDYEEVENATSLEELQKQTKRACYSATDVYEHIEFETAINPQHWYMNCIKLNLKTYNINEKYIETGWKINELKAGGTMQHTARRVIYV